MNKRLAAWPRSVALFCFCTSFVFSRAATSQDVEFIVAELGGVSVISIPQPSPLPGLLATKVVLRTDAENKLVTYENIQLTGAVHQTFIPGAFGGPPVPTPFVDGVAWSVLPPEWIAADSHILISPSMVQGGAGGSFTGISEVNDSSNPAGASEILPLLGGVAPAVTGIGNIAMEQPTDAFFVAPEFQTNEVDLAYVVTPDDSTGAAGDVFLTVGVLGLGIIDSGQPGGASFGFNGFDPVLIAFAPASPRPRITLATVDSPVLFGENVTLSAVATSSFDIASVEFFANDEAVPGCSFVSIPYQCEWTPSLPGSYNMTARATDVEGGVGNSSNWILRVESEPPLITLAAESSSILEGQSLILSADVMARAGEIASVDFFANNELIPNCSLTATPYVCEWTPDLAGAYNVRARATDSFGESGVSDIRSVLVESAAPTVSLTANRNSVPRGYGVTLSASATAKLGEIASVEFLSEGEPIPECQLVAAPYECEWTPDRPGSYNITARATDDSGRVSDSADTQLNVLAPFTWLSSEGVEVVFTPDPQPLLDGDLLGGTLSVESLDGSEISTFGGILMQQLHHLGVQQPTGVGPTVTAADHRDPAHARYDSHLLVTPDMIADSVGAMLQETGFDDPAAVDPAGVQDRIPADMFGNPAHTYSGDIVQGGVAASLRPEFRANSIDIARLVGRPGDVSKLRFDVLGDAREGNFEFEIGWTQPVGNPPTIQFDAPASIPGGTTATLSAMANDSDGDLALVEFFDNGVPIPACTFTEGPYECAWKPTGGSHKLRVTATDENGNRVRSEAAQVTVEPPPEFVVAELGGVSVISIPQPSPLPGLLATKVVLRTDAENKLVTYENIQITGSVHQTFLPGAFGGPPQPSPYVEVAPFWGIAPPEWISADSHILISPSMVAGGAGGSFTGISEVNDLSNPAGANENLPLLADIVNAVTGIGDISMEQPTDAFFLAPEFHTNEIDLAYVVTPDDSTGAAGDVFLTVGVLGEGIIDSGQPGGASFGFNGFDPVLIPFLPVSPKPRITLATLDSPVNFGDSVTLTAVATSSVDIAAVEFFANDEAIPECSFVTLPYECEWTPALPGSYNMTARATDLDGGVGNSSNWILRVESEPPLITLAAESSSILEGESLNLSANATARAGEIVSVEIFANNEPIPSCSFTATPYECEWTPDTAGSYNVTARATDSFGGFGDSDISSIFVESAAPLVALTADRTSVARGYGVTLSADATAKSGEIATVEFLSDGEPIPGCQLVAAPYACEWTPDRAGAYNITARATDDSGRVSDSTDTQLNVLPPFTWITSEGVEVVFTPDPEPLLDGDLLGGTLSVESLDGSDIVTLGAISMQDLHHVGVQQLTGVGPTVTAADHRDPAHAQYDSHLLITPDMIAGSVGDMLQETGFDDPAAVDPAGVQDRIPADMFGNPAHTYSGDIVHGDGAFFLRPEFRADSIDVARLVGRPGDVSALRLDVLGAFSGEGNFDFEIGWTQPVGNPPTIQFDAPADLIEIGSTVTLSASADDSDGDIALVEFVDNGVPIPACIFTEGPYECTWTPSGGAHKLRVTATDENGNRVVSESARIAVESFSPSVTLVNDLSPIVVGNSVTLAANAVSRVGSIELVEFFANDEPVTCDLAGAAFDRYFCEWTPSMSGSYNITARATDDSDRVGDSDTISLIVESDAPLITLTADRTSLVAGDSLTLISDATARSGEIASVEFFSNDELIPGCSLAALPYECVWTPNAVGSFNISARATDDSGRVGDSSSQQFSVLSPLTVSLSSPPDTGRVNRALLTGESLTLAADVVHALGEAIESVEILANDQLIPGCSFTVEPYVCEWTPDDGEHVVFARAQDAVGNVQDSPTGIVSVFPPGTGGIDDSLPRDDDGNIIVDADFHTSGGFGGPPIDIVVPGIPTVPLFVVLPTDGIEPITLLAIEEIEDEADMFAYVGDPPPIRFESQDIFVGPFAVEPRFGGEFSALYELTFDDGSRVLATISADVIPEPWTLGSSIVCLVGLMLYRRRIRILS